jgi:hypothetical protein
MRKIKFILIATLSIFSIITMAQEKPVVNKVVFESHTRGGHKSVEVTAQEMVFEIGTKLSAVKLKNEDWECIITIINNIALQDIEKWESPSKESSRDAAWISSISITVDNDQTFESNTFDNNRSPEKLSQLMECLIGLDKKYNKKDNRFF